MTTDMTIADDEERDLILKAIQTYEKACQKQYFKGEEDRYLTQALKARALIEKRDWTGGVAEEIFGPAENSHSENGHAENGRAQNGHTENGHTENGHALRPKKGGVVDTSEFDVNSPNTPGQKSPASTVLVPSSGAGYVSKAGAEMLNLGQEGSRTLMRSARDPSYPDSGRVYLWEVSEDGYTVRRRTYGASISHQLFANISEELTGRKYEISRTGQIHPDHGAILYLLTPVS